MNTAKLRYIPLVLALLLCQCGAPQPPKCTRVPMASRAPAASLIADAREQWMILGNSSRQSEWPMAMTLYNSSVAKLFDQLNCGRGDWDTRAASLGSRIAPPDERQANLSKLDALFPATLVNCGALKHHQTTAGIGVPLVGWKNTTPVGTTRPKYQMPNGYPYNLTATLDFDHSGTPVWHFTKRWLHDDVKIGKKSHVLAADWSAPNAFLWKMCELDNLKIQNVLMPEHYMQETGIYFLQPYDPEKIPLVFVHGLVSSPDAFKNMINDLAPNPWFREHYQVWLYNYPTGNPWLFSGAKFRESMREACAYARTKGDDHDLDRMVIVAHSMGGLVTRSSVTDPKHTLYEAYFDKPLDQLKISEPSRQLIRDTTLYQPLTEPKRVIFLAVPHRGSPVANFQASVWISRLIRLPKTLTIDLLDKTLTTVTDLVQGEDKAYPLPTSINSLSPNDRANLALDKLALPKQITFHSVIGDRGKGNTPDSSDGIVPYWSSHVTPVNSELIVPSSHSVPDNSQGSEELERILKLHLQSN